MQLKALSLLFLTLASVSAVPIDAVSDSQQKAGVAVNSNSNNNGVNSNVASSAATVSSSTGNVVSDTDFSNSEQNAAAGISTPNNAALSSGAGADSTSNVAQSAAAGISNGASSVSSAVSATRTRACDQGDQSLAAALQANVVIGLGQQAAVVQLQQLSTLGVAAGVNNNNNAGNNVNNNNFSSQFQAGVDRLNQFIQTSQLQIQTAQAIADADSQAQGQLQALQDIANSNQVAQLVASLTGVPGQDDNTLAQLLQTFLQATDLSQDGVVNAEIDCFLPLTTFV